MKVFRYDNYFDSITEVEVEAAVMNYWISPMIGDGSYIYALTYLEALQYREEFILEQLEEYKEKLRDVQNLIKENT